MTAQERIGCLVETVRQAAAAEAERLLREAIQSGNDLVRVEETLQAGVRGIGLSILEAALHSLGNGYDGSTKPCGCGKALKYMGDRQRDLVSLMGGTRLERAYYWCKDCRASEAPLDRRLEIEGTDFTPKVREVVARMDSEVAFGRGRELLGEMLGLWISKRKHEEISETLGTSLAPPDPQEQIRTPPQVHTLPTPQDLYLCADGTMAPTLAGWREVKLGAVFEGRVGADGQPARRQTRYIGDVVEAETFGWHWYAQARAMGVDQARRVTVLGDGAAWIWNLADLHFPQATQIVDWYHATERLWTVAHGCWGEGSDKAREWVRRGEILLHDSRVPRVIEKLQALRPHSREARDLVREAITYFTNNAQRMRYRQYRRQGLFIGSGVIEAAGKHIVGQRLKQSGMRWSLSGLRSILSLRLAVLNGTWPARNRLAG